MKATQALHEAGQSLWLDNITRTLLDAVSYTHLTLPTNREV